MSILHSSLHTIKITVLKLSRSESIMTSLQSFRQAAGWHTCAAWLFSSFWQYLAWYPAASTPKKVWSLLQGLQVHYIIPRTSVTISSLQWKYLNLTFSPIWCATGLGPWTNIDFIEHQSHLWCGWMTWTTFPSVCRWYINLSQFFFRNEPLQKWMTNSNRMETRLSW